MAEANNRTRGIDPILVTLAAGVTVGYEVAGDWFHVFEAPVNDLEVSFDSGKWFPLKQGVGIRRYYERVDLRSATGQAVQVGMGFGAVQDGRGSVSGFTVNTTVTPGNTLGAGGDVSVPDSAATQLLPANTDRLYALIKVPSSAAGPVRLGPAGVGAASGYLAEPGEGVPIATTAAIYAYHENGVAVTLSCAEVEEV